MKLKMPRIMYGKQPAIKIQPNKEMVPMGVHENIDIDKFPEQGTWLGRKVEVCFNYDTSKIVIGKIVREDIDSPGRMIIALDDGRFILSTECQYSLIRERR